MSVISVLSARANPGQRDEAIEGVREIRANCERLGTGFQSVKLYQSLIDGVATDTMHVATEYDDYASWAKSFERQMGDDRVQALVKRSSSPGKAIDGARRFLLEDRIKDRTDGFTTGPVLQMSQVQIKPGRASEIGAVRERAESLALDSGALDYRPLKYMFNGVSDAGMLLVVLYFQNLSALGESLDAQRDQVEWGRFWNDMTDANSPLNLVGSRILVEVPF